jgi:hypothetical protein
MWRDLVLLAAAALIPIVILVLGIFKLAALKRPVDLNLEAPPQANGWASSSELQSPT